MAFPVIVLYAVAIGLLTSTAISITYFWPIILDWLSSKIAPWIKENIGIKERDAFIEILNFLDNKITAVRRGVKGLVSKSILLIRSKFTKKGNIYKEEKMVYSPSSTTGKVTVQSVTEDIDWDDIPSDTRADFIRNPDSEKAINWLDKDILKNINES